MAADPAAEAGGSQEHAHTRTRPQAIAFMPPHSCNGHGHTSNRTRSNRDAKGSPPPPWTKPPACATDPFRLNSPLSQPPRKLVRSGGSRVPANSTPGLRNAGAQVPHTPNVTGPIMSHTQRPADPCTYPHLGGSTGRAADGLVSGGRRAGSGAGSGWGPLQRPRRGGSVRLSVRGSHRSEAAAVRVFASSYARARGGRRRRPIRSGAELTDS